MGRRRLTPVAAAALVAVACGLAVLARPARYEVEGLSMAPGLLPGDIVTTDLLPGASRLRRPRRFERWMLAAPDGTPAVKRIVGLPGENVSIHDGDLAIGGRVILAPPDLLAQTASPVPEAQLMPNAVDVDVDVGWQRTASLSAVYDDAAFAPAERRLLLPVRDVGLAAVIGLPDAPTDHEPVRVRFRIDEAIVAWNIGGAGRLALVAGRLDGHLVAAAWPLAPSIRWAPGVRSAMPPQPPSSWELSRLWPQAGPGEIDEAPVVFGLGLDRGGVPLDGDEADAAIERVAVWRDILWRPAADGRQAWQLGSDDFFLLGDFPSGSRDSRHWGPLGRDSLRHRAVPVRPNR